MFKRVIGLLALFILLLSSYSHAQTMDNKGKQIVLVVVPSFSFQEAEWLWVEGMERSLWEHASLGAMNVRPAGSYSYLNNTVTLSIGDKATGVDGWNSFERTEEIEGFPAWQMMLQLTGALPAGELLHPYFERLKQANQQEIGQLGELLARAGIDCEVFGHSDTDRKKIRYASLFTLNQVGEGKGSLVQSVKRERQSAFGMEMDEHKLLNRLGNRQLQNERSFTVVEWGDLHRLYEEKERIAANRFEQERSKQLRRLEQFINKAVDIVDGDVWLLAPMMHREAYGSKEQLAPFYQWGQKDGGFLTSATTRRLI